MEAMPMNFELYKARRSLPVIDSADKSSPTGLFSSDIFGVTEQERTTKAALINLGCWVMRPLILNLMRRINRKIVQAAVTRCKVYIRDGHLEIMDDTYQPQSGDITGDSGPDFLYTNWDKLDKKQFIQDIGRYSNIQMKKTISFLDKQEVFQHYVYVIPIGFREEDQDTIMVVDDLNILYADIIRYARLISASGLDGINKGDIAVLLQKAVSDHGDYIIDRFLGPKGVGRKQILSRNIDNSARVVLITNNYESKKIGGSKVKLGSIGMPIFHLTSMFRDTVLKFSTHMIEIMYGEGCFPEGVTSDMLIFYDMEYMTDQIKKFKDKFQRVQPFPAITADGTFVPAKAKFEVETSDGHWETIEKELTWLEFFYILLNGLVRISETRYTATTRHPVDSVLSMQYLKPITMTLTDQYLKHVKVFGFEFDDFPFVTDWIASNYQEKIFVAGGRCSGPVTTGFNGDHDGDQIAVKPINSEEAVAECNRINRSLLQIFDYDGNYRRSVGKDCDQTWYTFTRDPKPGKDVTKTVPANHPFMVYLDSVKDGKLDIEVLFKYTRTYDPKKPAELSILDTVNITRCGEKIKTTLGRYIFNKMVFHTLWDNKHFHFVNKPFRKGVLPGEMLFLKQLAIEGKCDNEDLFEVIDMSTEFGMRLSNVYNAALTYHMMVPDKKFKSFVDKTLKSVEKEVVENKNLDLLADAEDTCIKFAKEYYKNDDMVELLDSGVGSAWDNDFKTINISVGAVPTLDGEPITILSSLTDGVDPKYQADWTNTGMTGATNRAIQTAKSGAQNKDIVNGMQNVMGVKGDCGSKRGVKVNTGDPTKLLNRYLIVNGKPVLVTTDNVEKFLNKDVIMRSIIYCREKHGNYCSTCVGEEPFALKGTKKVPLGIMSADVASNILNLFMKSTHDLRAATYKVKDLNEFIYPKPKEPLFTNKVDPIDGVEKVYCTADITWKVPLAAVDTVETVYSVLAHGSVVTDKSGKDYSFVMGTEIFTRPSEILKPDVEKEHELERHVLFKYSKGDVFLTSTHTARKELTVYKMMNLFLSGNVSNLVPFETHFTTIKNTILTNKKVTINDISLELILSTLARDAKDITKPARETGTDDYVFVSLYDILCMSGTFNAVFGPDAVKSIVININKPLKEQSKSLSPMEKALRY